jgi:hypothetical protein
LDYLDFERKVGSISDIDAAESKLADIMMALNNGVEARKTVLLVDRYRCHGLLPCAPVELK